MSRPPLSDQIRGFIEQRKSGPSVHRVRNGVTSSSTPAPSATSVNLVATRTRCPCCGAIKGSAEVCCPLAPEPQPWCAWCGADLEDESVGRVGNRDVKRRVYCDHHCSVSYHKDLDHG